MNGEKEKETTHMINTANYRKPIKGTIARMAIQCEHPATKQIGTWLFTGDNHRDASAAVSPLHVDIYALCKWAQRNGFEGIGADFRFIGTQDQTPAVLKVGAL